MGKPLPQITFDFAGADETSGEVPAIAAEEKKFTGVNEPVMDIKEEKIVSSPAREASTAGPLTEPGVQDTVRKRGRRSLKEIAINADLIQVPDDETLFKKQYYSIGEVAGMFRENQSLIRYWETEFDILQPRKNRKGDRFFRPIDVKNLVLIYDLLRRRKFTIEGAKDYLKKNKKAEEKFAMIQSLEKIKGFLLELKANL